MLSFFAFSNFFEHFMSFAILSFKKDRYFIFTEEQKASVKFALLFVVLRIFSLTVDLICTAIFTTITNTNE